LPFEVRPAPPAMTTSNGWTSTGRRAGPTPAKPAPATERKGRGTW